MPGPKPKLEKLSTPITSSFPSEITSANTATPISALSVPIKPDPDFIKTPISPPSAYTDFLTKAMSLNSPLVASGETTPESASATDASEKSDSGKEEQSPATSTASSKPSPPATAAAPVPPSPFSAQIPMSAPPTGAATFPSLKLPASPASSTLESPLSAASTLRSPFSARSVHSVFDWDAALKARYADLKKQKASRTSVRHIREVVTRTVTYTPRMEPAPRGKRRKVE
ncbi:hypothetical protein K4F52_009954 [Lecanicillium sp. MT-2017a]|nr:hypothetical protein K4F52_009954 [Lecanicillium sp. MT-2017a]